MTIRRKAEIATATVIVLTITLVILIAILNQFRGLTGYTTLELDNVSQQSQDNQITFFFEFYGANSFAGNHEDEPHHLTLIDADIYKKGLISPKILAKPPWSDYGAKCLYSGNPNSFLISDVKNSN